MLCPAGIRPLLETTTFGSSRQPPLLETTTFGTRRQPGEVKMGPVEAAQQAEAVESAESAAAKAWAEAERLEQRLLAAAAESSASEARLAAARLEKDSREVEAQSAAAAVARAADELRRGGSLLSEAARAEQAQAGAAETAAADESWTSDPEDAAMCVRDFDALAVAAAAHSDALSGCAAESVHAVGKSQAGSLHTSDFDVEALLEACIRDSAVSSRSDLDGDDPLCLREFVLCRALITRMLARSEPPSAALPAALLQSATEAALATVQAKLAEAHASQRRLEEENRALLAGGTHGAAAGRRRGCRGWGGEGDSSEEEDEQEREDRLAQEGYAAAKVDLQCAAGAGLLAPPLTPPPHLQGGHPAVLPWRRQAERRAVHGAGRAPVQTSGRGRAQRVRMVHRGLP